MDAFPELPIYTGFNQPSRMEIDIDDLEIEGSLPDIAGAFYNVRPDPHYPPMLGSDIYFNGDGMISCFRFANGKVSFRSRYVKTPKFLAEKKAGRSLYGHYRNPLTNDPSVRDISPSTANTNIFFHAGSLYAMKEDSHPILIDPMTLETIGETDFDGKLTCPTFTAHPKVDQQTGEMFGFGYHAKGIGSPDVAYYVIDKSGKVVHETWFQVPYSNLMHDFAVTKDYVIFPIVPVTSSWERAKQNLPVFGWDSSYPTYLAVLPRYGKADDLRLFKSPTQFCSHILNAFNDGDKIYVDTPVCESNMFPFFPDVTGAPFDKEGAEARLTRWAVDMASPNASWEAERLTDLIGEFPRIDDRYACHQHTQGFLCVTDPSLPLDPSCTGSITGMFINAWGHVDICTGISKQWYCGPVSGLQEPVFVPRSADAAEGDGYLMGLCNRYTEMRSDLVILDTKNISDGPVCTVKLPTRLRNGLHGNWVPEHELSTIS